MPWIPRTTAAVTVLAALPFLTVRAPLVEIALPEAKVAPKSVPRGELPATWPTSLVLHLRTTRSLPIEVEDLQTMLRDVATISKRFQLDPLLVLAVIHVESGYDPFAISPAGSLGLMQLQVDTARDVAARLNIPWTSDDLLFDPRVNVLLGSCYLRELLDRFGDRTTALAAFHSGPSRVAGGDLHFVPAGLAYAERVQGVLQELELRAGAPRYS